MMGRRVGLVGLVVLGYALGAGSATLVLRLPRSAASDAPAAIALGGVFFKVSDPAAYRAWYERYLDVPFHEHERHFNFCWSDPWTGVRGRTVWGPFPDDTPYFAPGTRDYMHNFRVVDLDRLLAELRAEGVEILGDVEEYSYGRFAWILDGEGNRVELWEPSVRADGWEAVCARR